MTDHSFPDHGAQIAGIRMLVFYGRYNPQDMAYTNNNSAIILNKRYLLCISDTKRLIWHYILIKEIKDRLMVFRFLNPGRSKTKSWFPFRFIINSIFRSKIINIWMHKPRKRSCRERIPDENGVFQVPKDRMISMRVPYELIPVCPDNGGTVTMNLRIDDTFVEDAGWHDAADRYAAFLESNKGTHILFLELGVGSNTPMIVKYPFWAMTAENPNAVYACLNYDEAVCPEQIRERSICLDGDSGELLKRL